MAKWLDIMTTSVILPNLTAASFVLQGHWSAEHHDFRSQVISTKYCRRGKLDPLLPFSAIALCFLSCHVFSVKEHKFKFCSWARKSVSRFQYNAISVLTWFIHSQCDTKITPREGFSIRERGLLLLCVCVSQELALGKVLCCSACRKSQIQPRYLLRSVFTCNY